jgi:hypothetical protein
MTARRTPTPLVALATLFALVSTLFPTLALGSALLSQTGRLTVAGQEGDLFGAAVAVSGDTAIVGAPNVSLGVGQAQGRAFVFTRSDNEWVLEASLEPDDPIAGSLFGAAVDIDGDTAVVGALFEDEGANVRQGAVYVFTRSAGVWSQQQRLVPDDPASNDVFGTSVAVDRDTLLVGASVGDADTADNAGAVYVFGRDGGVWAQQQKLTASDPEAGALFGFSVALDAGTAAIGARGKDEGGAAASDAGAVYVFALASSGWTEQQKLLPNGVAEEDFFGTDVDLSGDTILVGCPGDDIGPNADKGSAFVYTRSGAAWSQQQKLTAADGEEGDRFGTSVALAGDTAVLGTIGDDINFDDQGSAYVFSRTGALWGQTSRLFAGNGAGGDKLGTSVALDDETIVAGVPFADFGEDADRGSILTFVISPEMEGQDKLTVAAGALNDTFGSSVDVSGDRAVVGAPRTTVGGNAFQGAAYVFERNGDVWEEKAQIVAANGAAGDFFGHSVAISGNTIVVGAVSDDGANLDQGAVYVFVGSGATWNQQARLTASDAQLGGLFGNSVAVSGDTLVVGAIGHDVGANLDEGKAYVFERENGSWTEQAQLTSSLGDPFDNFGKSVAIDASTIIVGAYGDDVGATSGQGAAYVFTRTGASWSQQARLLAGDGAQSDSFGSAVGLSGDTAVVGAFADNVGGRSDQGSAYVFVREGTSWDEQQKLTASDGAAGEGFGMSVAVSGDRVLVGGTISIAASAYLFVRAGTSWDEHQRLTVSNAGVIDGFGMSVALNGEFALVGAPFDTVGGNPLQGSAYAFVVAECPRITLDPSELPEATANEPYSFDVTTQDGVAPHNFSVSSGTLPPGLALDPATGELSGTPTQAGTYVFTITATDAKLCTGSRRYQLVVGCSEITVRPVNPSLPGGAIGAPYAATFTASGGAEPYTFAMGLGALPAGLTLDPATGELSGTATESGTFSFQVVATDASGCSGAQEYVLTIGCAAITIAPNRTRLGTGTAGTPGSVTISATGGTAPYTFEVVAGALPDGATLDPATGEVSGTPTTAGTFVFTVRVTDASGCSAEREYRMVIR